MIGIAAAAGLAGVPLALSEVGVRAAAADEITAAGFATVGLTAKAIGATVTYASDVIGSVETNTGNELGLTCFLR
jgi:hypothetical protein